MAAGEKATGRIAGEKAAAFRNNARDIAGSGADRARTSLNFSGWAEFLQPNVLDKFTFEINARGFRSGSGSWYPRGLTPAPEWLYLWLGEGGYSSYQATNVGASCAPLFLRTKETKPAGSYKAQCEWSTYY